MVLLEELSRLKKLKDLVGTRTRDLPACRIATQSPTLPLDMFILLVQFVLGKSLANMPTML
jgi:hypothetical protein